MAKEWKAQYMSKGHLKTVTVVAENQHKAREKAREKLIYMLCGICSARIGQALNLTLYDIDYSNKDVWLLKPNSDYIDMYGNTRRVWLKEE